MSSPTDIYVVLNHLDLGGTERHISTVLPRLDRTRFRVTVQVLRGGGPLESTLVDNGITVLSPAAALPLWARRLRSLASLLRHMLFRRPAIAHFFLPEPYLIGGLVGMITRQRTMVLSRRSLNDYQQRHRLLGRIERWLHRHVDAFVGNSRAVVRQLEEETEGRAPIRLIYNGIDIEAGPTADSRTRARRELDVPDGTVVFAIVANLIPYKGHADLLRALGTIHGRLPVPWRLYCIGRDGGVGHELRKLGDELGLAETVRWEGEQRDVGRYLHAADVGVLASHEEGFSNSILEGMAATLPMVVTDVGGNAEAVLDGETGLVVPPKDPQAMGTALLRLAGDPALRERFGRAGRRRVEQEFTLQRCVAEYEKLYTELVAARGVS